jgi:hypothetical protein
VAAQGQRAEPGADCSQIEGPVTHLDRRLQLAGRAAGGIHVHKAAAVTGVGQLWMMAERRIDGERLLL